MSADIPLEKESLFSPVSSLFIKILNSDVGPIASGKNLGIQLMLG